MKEYIEIPPAQEYRSLSLISFLENLWGSLRGNMAIREKRKTPYARLAGLSPRLLNDIGIDSRQALPNPVNVPERNRHG